MRTNEIARRMANQRSQWDTLPKNVEIIYFNAQKTDQSLRSHQARATSNPQLR